MKAIVKEIGFLVLVFLAVFIASSLIISLVALILYSLWEIGSLIHFRFGGLGSAVFVFSLLSSLATTVFVYLGGRRK